MKGLEVIGAVALGLTALVVLFELVDAVQRLRARRRQRWMRMLEAQVRARAVCDKCGARGVGVWTFPPAGLDRDSGKLARALWDYCMHAGERR